MGSKKAAIIKEKNKINTLTLLNHSLTFVWPTHKLGPITILNFFNFVGIDYNT